VVFREKRGSLAAVRESKDPKEFLDGQDVNEGNINRGKSGQIVTQGGRRMLEGKTQAATNSRNGLII